VCVCVRACVRVCVRACAFRVDKKTQTHRLIKEDIISKSDKGQAAQLLHALHQLLHRLALHLLVHGTASVSKECLDQGQTRTTSRSHHRSHSTSHSTNTHPRQPIPCDLRQSPWCHWQSRGMLATQKEYTHTRAAKDIPEADLESTAAGFRGVLQRDLPLERRHFELSPLGLWP
jgi:hypothetical protein